MSKYGISDYDNMYYELNEFLKDHTPAELLKLVQESVDWWEVRTEHTMEEFMQGQDLGSPEDGSL